MWKKLHLKDILLNHSSMKDFLLNYKLRRNTIDIFTVVNEFCLKILPNSQNWKSYFFIWRWKIKKSEDMKKYICLGFLLALAFAASAEKLDDFERSKLFIVKSIFRESFFVNHFSIHSVQTWCYLWWSFCSLLQRLS